MSRILFSGYYGLGNAGDEAVLAASIDLLRTELPGAAFTVLSGNPAATAAEFKVDAAPRMAPGAVIAAIRSSDLVLSGGGSLLQDRTSMKSLLYYLAILALAKRMGKKTMVFAQGIGPLHRPAARRLTARVLRGVDAITVRDADSADLLTSIGVSQPAPEVTADPVFALRPKVTDRVRAAAAERPVVGVSLRPWPGVEGILEPLAHTLSKYDGEFRVQLWPLFPEQDSPLCASLQSLLPGAGAVPPGLTPGEWMCLAGWTDAIIGMRLHSLIFGAARGTPILGISYDPKVDALLGRLRARAVGTAASLDTAALETALDAALSGDEAKRRDREMRSAHLQEAAIRNARRAAGLLSPKSA